MFVDELNAAVAKEVQAARDKALEEAAKIVESLGIEEMMDMEDVAKEIRALKSSGGEKA